jgi:formate dehydrogenase subunit gamma
MITQPNELPRHTISERVNHWLTAICFVLLALSGLAFFHPLFWPLAQLFGGGVWSRIVHPFMGIVLFILFAFMFGQFQKLNRMTPADWEWLKHIREVVGGNDRNMPPQGKYNGGQKVLFWALSVCIALMALSGVIMWRAYFTFPLTLVRVGAVVHAAAGAVVIALIILHIYAAIWTKGTISAMLYGKVTRGWARQHHENWYRESVHR